MNSVDAFEKDILLQLEFLKSFRSITPLSIQKQKNVFFSGSGDSLASSMLAESFSSGKIRAMDPLDLYKNKELVKTKSVYFVSISGNTITNIKTAANAKNSVAITSQPHSKLANASDSVILLTAPNSGVFTAGSISFLESALTCISLVTKFALPDTSKLFLNVKNNAKKANLSKRVFVLGNLYTFPLAMYCAAKFYEVLGYDAHYSRLEQFSHMELFSIKKGDTVIIFEEKNPHNTQLRKNIKKIGINIIQPSLPENKISQMLYCTFFSQLIVLFEARKKQQKECYFITAKKIRNVSNKMIY